MASYTYELVELGDEGRLGCKCCRFTRGADLPIPKKLSLEAIDEHARSFSSSIFADWTKLNAILKRFEGTIQKRWLKKNTKQRREILLKAWPKMPTSHRPDFMGFRNVNKNAPRSRTLPSGAYLWPYVNLEDLLQRDILLLFINSRGRNLPELFLISDIRAAHLGEGWKQTPDENDMTGMRFYGSRTPRTYGCVTGCPVLSENVDSNIIPEAPKELRQSGMLEIQCGSGLLMLEIQKGIYGFLLSCAKLILHDVHPTQFFLAAHQPAPPPLLHCTNQWPSLDEHLLETPYRLPQMMDLDKVKMLVGSRRASAEDHAFMLREDPSYFIDTLKEWREHDKHALIHKCTTCCEGVAGLMMSDAVTYYIYWDQVYRILDNMPSMESQLEKADHTKLRLPEKAETLWAKLLSIVDEMIEIPIQRLTFGFPASPRMRHCFAWAKKGDEDIFDWEYHSLRHSSAERRVNNLFYAICNPDQRKLHGLHHLIQEVQYMLDTDPAASQLVDSWIIGHFADLALLSELSLRIQGLDPWFRSWQIAGVQDSQPVQQMLEKLMELNRKLDEGFWKACRVPTRLVEVNSDAWDYPAGKKDTEENVKQMRRAEACLDVFMFQLEDRVRDISGHKFTKVMERRLFEKRKIYRTPEWIPPLVPQEPQVIQAVLKDRNPNASTFGFHDSSGEKYHTPNKPKAKVKTRGTPTAAQELLAAAAANNQVEAPDPNPAIIQLPKRTHKVLSALIPAPNSASHQRSEISWDELLQALDSIGLQPEKRYGSVWVFSPKAKEEQMFAAQGGDEWLMERSIQFHEPKEVRRGSKIPAAMVRTFGRRLGYVYGWKGEMFGCE